MDQDGLPPETETWEEFRKICAHWSFSGTSNHQAVLRWLIKRRYAGGTDFAGKIMAVELFKRDTSIAKVEASAVRKKLDKYFEGDGRNDPIVICIPRQTYRPSIFFSAVPFNERIFHKFKEVDYCFDEPSRYRLDLALQMNWEALQAYPNHPRLLAQRSVIHVMRAVFGEDPAREYEMAEYVLRDVFASKDVEWETRFSQACLCTSRFNWKRACTLFNEAIDHSGRNRPVISYAPGILYLVSQTSFSLAAEILEDMCDRYTTHTVQTYSHLLLVLTLDGKMDAATKCIRSADYFKGLPGYGYNTILPMLALFYAVTGDYEQASQISTAAANKGKHDTILSPITLGLTVLYTGLGGNKESAKAGYEEFADHRAAWKGYPSVTYDRIRVSAMNVGLAAVGAGYDDLAVEWFAIAALKERDPSAMLLNSLPVLYSLHHHKGFRDLVIKKMGLPMADVPTYSQRDLS